MFAVPEAATPFQAEGRVPPATAYFPQHMDGAMVIEPRPLNAQVSAVPVRREATGQIATLIDAFGLQNSIAMRALLAAMICDGVVVTWASHTKGAAGC